ncbi:YjbE family integral membrane protein [Clostridium algifaecis]|uniref:YjbE family integral membrane protein n=1 Tax=Clostridium algifaecis TaxID=1472040 RepID=A0ABS4KSQ7_9CLOT|nr:TerC family protein [Clostridium algifaecis]MBP2031884.1 YjbE family integral membrane protein [Clostridium algifaecis]
MENLTAFIIQALQITLLDVVLSGDNIGVIALATRKLPEKYARSASLIGVFAAVLLRIIFACLVTYILMIDWLPIRLIGGIILIKITFDFIKPESKEDDINIHTSNKFMGAVISIVAADATMSLDNVLAIASLADGNDLLIIFGLILNIPIIFFGSQFVANLMKKYPIVTYIGAAILAHTSFKLLFEDNLTRNLFSPVIVNIISYGAAVLTIVYGLYIIKKPTLYSFKKYKEYKNEDSK